MKKYRSSKRSQNSRLSFTYFFGKPGSRSYVQWINFIIFLSVFKAYIRMTAKFGESVVGKLLAYSGRSLSQFTGKGGFNPKGLGNAVLGLLKYVIMVIALLLSLFMYFVFSLTYIFGALWLYSVMFPVIVPILGILLIYYVFKLSNGSRKRYQMYLDRRYRRRSVRR